MNEPSVLFFDASGDRILDDMSLMPGSIRDNGRRHADDDEDLELTNQRLRIMVERLERLAFVDELTGLANRRCFDVALESEIRRATRERSALTLMFCDIDRFKRHNDRFGHRSGDAVLKRIGNVLQLFCRRAGDCAARYGGEEFALILPQTRDAHAGTIAEELRQMVEGLIFGEPQAAGAPRITISIGVTTFDGERACTAGALIDAADAALYQAKNSGRNQVRFRALDL